MKRLSMFFVFCLVLQLVAAGTVLAGDATSFDPTRVAVVPKGAGGVPVGTIVAWPVAKNPEDMDNWLECNGQTVNVTVYPELFALRGLFLRGVGGNSAGLGVRQEDAGRNITGYTGTGLFSGSLPTGAFLTSGSTNYDVATLGSRHSSMIDLDDSRVWGVEHTANEFRPANTAVRYLVRTTN